ncbi:Ger(x)C family spore germination protein [Sedimentibacter sp. zth1]|uniref:Ger(x)C family spore germination protein n=1 Tax=Sedimentibacter sp. zth1 TaxID=2816908 RepID=UPI001A92CB49|nr:Ger(x)C family spore germination protein [Sedimentibacter sp. zth1]QSX05245.1 Ger(x)C family spore germination protein [Sedimentibacter sp. zth1]
MKYKILALVLIIIFMFSLVGCGIKDAVEINKREYIFAVGIDTNDNATSEEDEYTFTAEIPVLNTGSQDKRFVITQNCNDLTSFYYNNILSTDKIASDSMMQVIIIGEDVLKDKDTIKRMFDEIERSPQINRKVKIVVAKGKASDIVNFEIADNPLIGRYISEFLIKLKKLSFQTTYSFDEVVLYLQNLGNALIPAVEIKNDRLSIDGAAVIKKYELIDYINHDENGIISMLTKGAATGMNDINIKVDEIPVSLTYENVVVSQDINIKGEKLDAKLYVTVYLNINSYDLTKTNSSDIDFERKLCNETNALMSKYTKKLLQKMQEDYKMDILGIQDDLMKFDKTDYDKIKDKYEEVFESANINVYYNVKINNSGMVK